MAMSCVADNAVGSDVGYFGVVPFLNERDRASRAVCSHEELTRRSLRMREVGADEE